MPDPEVLALAAEIPTGTRFTRCRLDASSLPYIPEHRKTQRRRISYSAKPRCQDGHRRTRADLAGIRSIGMGRSIGVAATMSSTPPDPSEYYVPCGRATRPKRVWPPRACGADIAGHPSQDHCLAKDSVAHVPMKRLLGPHMDLDPEQLLQVLNQPGMIQQTPARLPRYQQIEVAALVGFASGHGAEHAQVVSCRRPFVEWRR
jgi:hypothetical protein